MLSQITQQKILRTTCPDTKGLLAQITSVCFAHQLNIIENNEYVDNNTGYFFMRTKLDGVFNNKAILADLKLVLPAEAICELLNHDGRRRIVLLATKEAHCIGDILIKSDCGDLDVEIAAVISNYDVLQSLVERFDIPFYLVSHKGITREEHDANIIAKIDNLNPDYIVLAKYMRVLTPKFVCHYPQKIINIHHSFLPAFIGARPYHQAYYRGVKIIGVTVHYVNNNLDKGPIIIQDVIHIDHNYTADDMARVGQDIEKNALSRALYCIIEQRVFICGNRTIIF